MGRRRKWRIRRKNETERHWTLRVKRWRTRRINRRMRLRKEREGLNDDESSSDSNDESSGLDISDTTLHKQIIDWRTKQRKLGSERRIKLRIVRQSETADQRKVRIAWRVRRRTKRRKLRLSRKGWSFLQWKKRNSIRIRRRKWKLRRNNETVRRWKSRLRKDRRNRRNQRLIIRRRKGLAKDDEITDYSSSSGDSDYSGLDVTDPSLKKGN